MSASTMHVTFWGTRGSISTPGNRTKKYGGNTACVSVQHRDTTIILDAGTGIRDLGNYLVAKASAADEPLRLHLLLSHTHWDHIQGIPFFVPAYLEGTRLTVYGSPHKEEFLESILRRQMDINYFPVEMKQLAADITIKEISADELKIDDITIDWQEQELHPGGSVRYGLRAGDKRIVYASDVELDKAMSPEHADDGEEQLREYKEFIAGADLLIADGQYTEREYAGRAGFGHTSIPLIIETAYEQKVKQLALFHHDPSSSDSMLDALWTEFSPGYSAKQPPMNIFWAREGMTVAI